MKKIIIMLVVSLLFGIYYPVNTHAYEGML